MYDSCDYSSETRSSDVRLLRTFSSKDYLIVVVVVVMVVVVAVVVMVVVVVLAGR